MSKHVRLAFGGKAKKIGTKKIAFSRKGYAKTLPVHSNSPRSRSGVVPQQSAEVSFLECLHRDQVYTGIYQVLIAVW